MESFTTAIESLMKNHTDFQRKFKQKLVRESSNVMNPVKFIDGLLSEGVLNDNSNDSDAVNEYKEMMVQLALKIASSQGADGISGLVKALEGSGNSELVTALRTWTKKNFGVDTTDGELSEQKEGAAALLSPATKRLPKNVKGLTELRSTGTKLIDNITSHLADDWAAKLKRHLVGKASEIVMALEFRTSLVHQNVLEETDIQLAAGPEVQEVRLTEKAIKAACSKKAIGSLVLALESSNNERILVETFDWLQTSEMRKKNYPISVKSLARDQNGRKVPSFEDIPKPERQSPQQNETLKSLLTQGSDKTPSSSGSSAETPKSALSSFSFSLPSSTTSTTTSTSTPQEFKISTPTFSFTPNFALTTNKTSIIGSGSVFGSGSAGPDSNVPTTVASYGDNGDDNGDEDEGDEKDEDPMFLSDGRAFFKEDGGEYQDYGDGTVKILYDGDHFCGRFIFISDTDEDFYVDHIIAAETTVKPAGENTFEWGCVYYSGDSSPRSMVKIQFPDQQTYDQFSTAMADSVDIAMQAGVTEDDLVNGSAGGSQD